MQARVRRRTHRVNRQVSEMAWAVPQVVHERVSRMLLAGAQPNARDQREFYKMGAEKVAAFQESWVAVGLQSLRAQQEIATAWMHAAMSLPLNPWAFNRVAEATQAATLGLMGAGLAPVHGRAVGNARRLNRDRA